jgi:hypothetical protein
MFSKSATLAIAALSAISSMAPSVYAQNITRFQPPTMVPFLHIDLRVANTTFVTAVNGVLTGQANNQGGKCPRPNYVSG